jgi:hypothetical protein
MTQACADAMKAICSNSLKASPNRLGAGAARRIRGEEIGPFVQEELQKCFA